jgi:hypothetical protein
VFGVFVVLILLASSTGGYVACGAFIATGHPWIAALAFVTQVVVGSSIRSAIDGTKGEP